MNKYLRGALIGVGLAIVLYAASVVWLGWDELAKAAKGMAWWGIAAALLLSSINYLLRFWKWELCLGWLHVRGDGPDDAPNLSLGRSLQIYLAGMSMSVTPGKLGEVLRSGLLKSSDGVSFGRTAPIVLADRLTDVVALVLLTLIGIGGHPEYLNIVIAAAVLVVLGALALGHRPTLRWGLKIAGKLPIVGKMATKAESAADSSAALLRPVRIAILGLISVVGWGCECLGYWAILSAFPGIDANLGNCTFLWAATTLIGALSFLPGGLGATEGSLTVLAVRTVSGVSAPIAAASTLLIRLCTLWYGEVVGGLALALFMRKPHQPLDQVEAETRELA